jgi:hypothetical protein
MTDELVLTPAVPAHAPTVQEQILEVGARWRATQHRLVHLVAELDETGDWVGQGRESCAHWVADALDIEVCTAREWLRVGRALRGLPHTDAAFEAGLSYSKVRALTRVAAPGNEQELLELAYGTAAGHLGTVLAAWCAAHEDPVQTRARQCAARAVSWRTEPDGMIHGWFRLPPLEGRRLTAAIDARTARAMPGGASADAWAVRWPSMAQQRADALAALATGGGSGFLTELVINVGPDGGTFPDGTPIPWPELERIAPESFVRALIHDAERRPVNASSRQRHPTTRQKRVVAARSGGRCEGCGATEFLEFHHDPPHEVTGHTVVDELKHECRHCHRAEHGDSP